LAGRREGARLRADRRDPPKAGYDPAELFLATPGLRTKLRVARRLAQKMLGFRYVMDVIPLTAIMCADPTVGCPMIPFMAPC